MATYAKNTFNAAVYAASRPTYPRSLFQLIFDYHKRGAAGLPTASKSSPSPQIHGQMTPRWNFAVDLGCGTGQATTELSPFKQVIGVDPSAVMLEKATKHVKMQFKGEGDASQFKFVQSSAEKLEFIEDGSVDLVVAGETMLSIRAVFSSLTLIPTISAQLKLPIGSTGTNCGPRSTGSFDLAEQSLSGHTYSELRLPQYPSLTPRITDYLQGSDYDTSLGPHWERPGRTILERHLIDVPEPKAVLGAESTFSDTDRIYFAGSYHPELPKEHTLPVILRSKSTWNGLLGYFHSFSALHTYLECHPGDADKEGGSIAERTWKALIESAEKVKSGEVRGEDELTIEWPVAMVLAKRL